MKKLASLLLSVILMVSLASCKGSVQDSRGESSSPDSRAGSLEGASGEEPGEPDPGSSQAGKTKSLVVYFSWSGNTEMVAQEIQRQTGAELFQIVPAQPYTENYNALLWTSPARSRRPTHVRKLPGAWKILRSLM